jgi:hypothetical protein
MVAIEGGEKAASYSMLAFPLYSLQRQRRDFTSHAVARFTFSEAPCNRDKP